MPYFYAMSAILCWASLPAATGSGLKGLSTEELLFYSFTAAAVYLYGQQVILTRRIKPFWPDWRSCLLGIWGIFLYHYLYYTALDHTPLAEGAILTTTWSFWIVIFSSIIASKTLKPSVLVIALVGLSGAALVVSSGRQVSFDPAYVKGYTIALGCGLVWSSFSVSLPYRRLDQDPMPAFTILAALFSAALFIVSGPHRIPDIKALGSALYLGTVPLGLSFFLWNRAITSGNLSIIGMLSYLTPPLAVLLVAIVHHQQISHQVISGMILILAASIVGKKFLKT